MAHERYPARMQGIDVNGRSVVFSGAVAPLAQLMYAAIRTLPQPGRGTQELQCPYCGHGAVRRRERPASTDGRGVRHVGWSCPRCEAESA